MEQIVCNYLKIGNKTYSVKEVDMPDVDINEELRLAYEAQYRLEVEKFGQGVVQNVQDEWNNQINHLQNCRGSSSVQVPNEYVEDRQIMVVRNNRCCPCREVRYSPHELQCSWTYLPSDVRDALITHRPLFDEMGLETTAIIKFKPTFVFPLVISFSEREDKLYAENMRYFHSFSGGKICTSRHRAQDIWNLPINEFYDYINRINWYSPASTMLYYRAYTLRLSDFVNNNTFESVTALEAETWMI